MPQCLTSSLRVVGKPDAILVPFRVPERTELAS